MPQYKVTIDQVGYRLDKFLLSKIKNISRARIQKNIKAGLYTVNGKIVPPHYFLKSGDVIVTQAFLSASEAGRSEKSKKIKPKCLSYKIQIMAETNDYLVINKPVGLLVHPTQTKTEFTLVDWLIKKYPVIKKVYDHENKLGILRPGIVHRLDRDVSGLMIIAKTQPMFDALKNQFKQRIIKKEYLALVHGVFNLNEGKIERAIARSKKTGLMVVLTGVSQFGKEAITEFEVVKRFKNYTLLKIKLLTGRTHQIRVHLKSIGHSIVGDKLYQTRDVRLKKGKIAIENIFLYSAGLGFNDLENNWQEFKLKEPKWWQEFLRNLKS